VLAETLADKGHRCAVYPSSSVTDAQWAILQPLLSPPGNTTGRDCENINFFGAIEVDIDAELAQLDPTGYRRLRVRDTLF
jgi:hypothetical protein